MASSRPSFLSAVHTCPWLASWTYPFKSGLGRAGVSRRLLHILLGSTDGIQAASWHRDTHCSNWKLANGSWLCVHTLHSQFYIFQSHSLLALFPTTTIANGHKGCHGLAFYPLMNIFPMFDVDTFWWDKLGGSKSRTSKNSISQILCIRMILFSHQSQKAKWWFFLYFLVWECVH